METSSLFNSGGSSAHSGDGVNEQLNGPRTPHALLPLRRWVTAARRENKVASWARKVGGIPFDYEIADIVGTTSPKRIYNNTAPKLPMVVRLLGLITYVCKKG